MIAEIGMSGVSSLVLNILAMSMPDLDLKEHMKGQPDIVTIHIMVNLTLIIIILVTTLLLSITLIILLHILLTAPLHMIGRTFTTETLKTITSLAIRETMTVDMKYPHIIGILHWETFRGGSSSRMVPPCLI